MGKTKIRMLKKLKTVPKNLGIVHGQVGIRPISFGMDRTIDKYVVSGGGHRSVVTGSKRQARTVASARVRVIEKHRQRRMKRKR